MKDFTKSYKRTSGPMTAIADIADRTGSPPWHIIMSSWPLTVLTLPVLCGLASTLCLTLTEINLFKHDIVAVAALDI